MSTIKEFEIYYCKTQLEQNKLIYTWNNKLGFYVYFRTFYDTRYDNIYYCVFLKTNKNEIINVLKPTRKKIFFGQNNLLYELPISTYFFLIKMTKIIYLTTHNIISHSHVKPAITDTNIFVSKEKSVPFVSCFVINNERLDANKTMFNCSIEESVNNEVVITDIRYDILKELLYFVQIGYLSKPLEKLYLNGICELFVAADKYDIQDLKSICEQHLIIYTTKKM
ncbi:hypothetical protein ACFW04_004089 [Cataglyphis niger]